MGAIERHLASLPVHSSARLLEDPSLGLLMVRAPGGEPSLDYAALPRWAEADKGLDALEARFREAGAWPCLLVGRESAPAGLVEELQRRRWHPVAPERVLWTRDPVTVPHLDPTLRVEAVTRRSMDEHLELERRIFGLPESTTGARREGLAAGISDGTLRAFIVRVAGTAVAIARISLLDRPAGLYGIGVVPERRRQGFGSLITAISLRAALATGGPLAWLSVEEGNEPARVLYERLGFRPAFGWARWVAPAT
jgi:ribosomal protein S18 acetylase RimI-like enzyme